MRSIWPSPWRSGGGRAWTSCWWCPKCSSPGTPIAPKAGFENLLTEQAQEWLDEALALVPARCPGAGPHPQP